MLNHFAPQFQQHCGPTTENGGHGSVYNVKKVESIRLKRKYCIRNQNLDLKLIECSISELVALAMLSSSCIVYQQKYSVLLAQSSHLARVEMAKSS